MSSLPTTNRNTHESVGGGSSFPKVLRRLYRTPRNLDFETAIWEMIHLIFRPRKAFRSFYYQHQTKHQWARDDPSFFILQIGLLLLSSIVWSTVYGHTFFGFLGMIFNMVFIDFFLIGFAVATMFWLILNRPYFKFRSASESQVEWAYCFDVHCNAFLIIWVLLYFLQFLLLPVIKIHKWIGLFVGNTLYCLAFGQYFILTFYGYSQLPFLKSINFMLIPALAFAVLYLVSLVGIDLSTVLSFHN